METNPRPVRYRRRRKLIKPRLQLKLVGSFVGLSALALLVQFALLARNLSDMGNQMPEGGDDLAVALPDLLTNVFVLSFGLLLPLTISFGILFTFRIAGPVYRFEQHLGAVARGENPGVCRLRKGDDLQELCALVNAGLDASYERGRSDAVREEERSETESSSAAAA